MTTNGLTLSHKVRQLKEAGLAGLNVSLDTLVPQKFEFISRRRGWDKVMRGIDHALQEGFSPLKVGDVHSMIYCACILRQKDQTSRFISELTNQGI